MEIYLVIAAIGLLAGACSGMLGIGGGIIVAPLLLFVPPLLGLETLDMHTVAGLTIVQSLLGTVAGAFFHRKLETISWRLSAQMGVAIFLTAGVGGVLSSRVSGDALLFVFATLAMVASGLMVVKRADDPEHPDADRIEFSSTRAGLSAGTVGLLGGLVGQGGSFLLIPLMTSFVRVPTRIAISSNLVIVAASSLAGVIGKAMTGQVEWLLTIPLALSVIPAARMGTTLSARLPVAALRRVLAALIALAALRMWYQLL